MVVYPTLIHSQLLLATDDVVADVCSEAQQRQPPGALTPKWHDKVRSSVAASSPRPHHEKNNIAIRQWLLAMRFPWAAEATRQEAIMVTATPSPAPACRLLL